MAFAEDPHQVGVSGSALDPDQHAEPKELGGSPRCLAPAVVFCRCSVNAPHQIGEWFIDRSTSEGPQIICLLEELKGDSNKHETLAYPPDAQERISRILKYAPLVG